MTDSKGLVAGEIKIPVAGGEIPGYRAMPAVGGPFATVLVVHEIFGVHEHIKDISRRLPKSAISRFVQGIFTVRGRAN
jgi:carboxymethylenebutenolidase